MSKTYCGKLCEECAYKNKLGCMGCKAGPGSLCSGGCELAECCFEKGHESCDSCALQERCSLLRTRESAPEQRYQKQTAQESRQERLMQKSALLGKWLWILFWLIVPNTLAGLIGLIPALFLPGKILEILVLTAYALILQKAAAAEENYHAAGVCMLVSVALEFVSLCLFGERMEEGWGLLLMLPAAILLLVGEYYEYMGHADVLMDVDSQLSEKWRKLWKWYIGAFAATLGSIVLALFIPMLALFLILAAEIAILVVSILKLVYLYRTAKRFREFSL